MFYIKKTFEISASHQLQLKYKSPCENLHGHNWKIIVYCKKQTLIDDMVIDFKLIKDRIHSKLDHQNLNDIFDFNPTAENIAYWISEQIPYCYKVTVIESENNEVTYEL